MNAPTALDYHQKAYVCTHVFQGHAPVLLVSRPDGDWCFLCGQLHAEDGAAYKVIGMGHLLERDESLRAVIDLAPGWEAERTGIGQAWLRTRLEADN
jgi:hypothetical protein